MIFAIELMVNKKEGEPVTDVMKRAGATWKELSDKDKLPYEARHAKDVLR